MKKNLKKTLAALMAVLMILSAAPLSSLAGIDLGSALTAAAVAESGKCGTNVNYTYDSTDKKLIISGSGAMSDYKYNTSPFYGSDVETVVIKKGVTAIGDNAFRSCESLKSVTLPSTVKELGECSFANCSSLKAVSVPKGVKTIPNAAFTYCTNLVDVTLPDTLTKIDEWAFSYCTNLEEIEIPDSVTVIKERAFCYCDNLQSITIPDGVTKIEAFTFDGCVGLESVKLSKNLTSIGGYAFSYCHSLKEIVIPDSVTSIGGTAFWYCTSLKSINIPYAVTVLAGDVFMDSPQLEVVVYNPDCHFSGNCGLTETNRIVGYAGSTAEAFADGIGAEFVDITTAYPLGTTSKITASQTADSITLKWNKVSGAAGYRVFIYDGGWKVLKDTTKLTYTVANLSTGKNYKFAVRAYVKYNGKTVLAPKYRTFATCTCPVAPATVKASEKTTTSVTLTWSKCTGATGYRVYMKTANGWKALKTTGELKYKVTGLKKGTSYTFAVKPYTKYNGSYVWAKTYTSFKCTTFGLDTPTARAASLSKGKATVAWSNVSGESGYQVFYSTKASGGYVKLGNYAANTVKMSKTGLTSGKTYYFRVRAYTKANGSYVYSDYSDAKSVKVR